MQFNHKILGLNTVTFGTVLGGLGTDLRTAIDPCVLFYVLLLKK